MIRSLCRRAAWSVLILCVCRLAAAQQFDEKFDYWPSDLRIGGTLILASQLDELSVLKDAVGRSPDERRVVLLVDSADCDELAARYRAALAPSKRDEEKSAASDTGKKKSDDTAPFDVVPITEDVGERLAAAAANCDILCWHSTKPHSAESHARFAAAAGDVLKKHLDAGRTLLIVGEAARCASRFYVDSSNEQPRVADGLNLIPDCIVATDYTDAQDRGQLLAALATHPRSVGIGVEKNAAVVLAGRTIRVVGSGSATLLLMANERQPLRVQTIAERRSPRQPPEDYLADLTEWRRDAIDRTLDPFPPEKPRSPVVEDGALVIVGGGGMPRGLMRKFIDLAGGNENAKLVYVPCAEEDDVGNRHGTIEQWNRMGVEHCTFIHTKDRNRANNDEEFLAPLRDATGIWFGGGRQWNLADSYYGTTAHRLMKEVLHRGGVIGGSSAGASIQARYLARATPIGNTRIMAPGYERGGLGFLSGVAIDQHFTQRGRQRDMTDLLQHHPQLLGIGLDEATAIVVTNSTAEVVGEGKVHFYDRRQPVYPDRPDYIALPEGGRFDLVERKPIQEESPAKDAE
ncbi:MAG: Type 1 glutamine amidotransferase-like domain-containing protein [Pirellulales bacterium]